MNNVAKTAPKWPQNASAIMQRVENKRTLYSSEGFAFFSAILTDFVCIEYAQNIDHLMAPDVILSLNLDASVTFTDYFKRVFKHGNLHQSINSKM